MSIPIDAFVVIYTKMKLRGLINVTLRGGGGLGEASGVSQFWNGSRYNFKESTWLLGLGIDRTSWYATNARRACLCEEFIGRITVTVHNECRERNLTTRASKRGSRR
ncbi:uncharacterized protein LOC114941715 [Nylanderia fulva]|uniref:uncharacterized protein LOC114941715 n=1 Tax=Nylanderia fulva TaxID=613905 RepID=UPI0010FB0475|nr:uncharacterized protein LOC114941715 [Nylanderia fulva]